MSSFLPSQSGCTLSIVLPCLNEADTVGECVDDVSAFLKSHALNGEIIVADNNSTDASAQIASARGARVVVARERGYGNALRAGLSAARGDAVIMMDSDSSYRAADIAGFLSAFDAGADFVQGCRFSAAGGVILPGAMPLLHRMGNPLFTRLLRHLFHLPLHDVHCGMRAVSKTLLEKLSLHAEGMECAFELLLEAQKNNAQFAEVPVTLYPDGRRAHGAHLRTFRDGYRMLVYVCRYKAHSRKNEFVEKFC